eukprot:1564527-Rhodomonas_salina.2
MAAGENGEEKEFDILGKEKALLKDKNGKASAVAARRVRWLEPRLTEHVVMRSKVNSRSSTRSRSPPWTRPPTSGPSG